MKNKESKATKEFKEKFFAETSEIITNVLPIVKGKMFNAVIDSFITISAKLIVDNFKTQEEVSQCGMDFMQKFMIVVEDCYKRKEEKEKV